MGDADGSLNTLLKYRFVRKTTPKINHSDHRTGISRESSMSSTDSQSTIPYLCSQNSVSSVDGDPIADKSSNSRALLGSPPRNNQTDNIPSSSRSCLSPNTSINSSTSPVFKSKLNGIQLQKDQNEINSPSTSHVVTSPGPWVSKVSGSTNHSDGHTTRFKNIKRPEPDSDDDVGDSNGVKIDAADLQKMKEMFPGQDVRYMKAALFLYSKDFKKAVEYLKKIIDREKPTVKRPLEILIDDDSDELPEITGARKRIKVMPDTPSPTPNCSQHIKSILSANEGDTEKAVVALTNEDGADAQHAKSLSETIRDQTTPGPSANNVKKVSVLSYNMANGESSDKNRNRDHNEDEDEEDDYDEENDSEDSEDSEEWEHKSKSVTDNYLAFFEEATIEELTALPGCSKKKAEAILTLRPFNSYENLCVKFAEEKQLSTSLISGCKEIMQVRNTIRRLMYQCENISQVMGNVVSSLSEQSNKGDISDHDDIKITKQPELLNKEFILQPYQLIGLSWLRIMHEQEVNGILADEMGLGKTIQAIAFLAHLLEEGEEGPHVIIVPSSTIENWLRELQRWCSALKVLVYFGSMEERRCVRHSVFNDGEEFNILLTTYNMATGGAEDRVLFKKFDFHYAIFDEGHMLKNMSSLRFQNLMKISAERRLLLTGTPLQNNLLELMSLLCFVMPDIFQGKTEPLKKMFAMISKAEDKQKSRFEQDRIIQAKRIMKPFILRRLKKDVLKQLPKKTEHLVKCSMVPCQQELYDSLVNHYVEEVANREESGDSGHSNGGIGLFMQFRKAANHPMLVRHRYTNDMLKQMATKVAKEPSHRERGALPKLIQEDMSVMNDFELTRLCRHYKKYLGKFELDPSVIDDSGKFRKLDELLPEMKEKGDRVLLFSQFTMMLDVVEHYLEHRQHKYLRMDGQTPVTDRLQLIDRFNNEPDIFIFLLSTRAGGVGINLAAANTIIIHDIDFNPYNDKQAEDRCHRLGQKREVNVIKLISTDTVDENMLKCANDKLALEKDLTGSGQEEENEDNSKDVANLLKEVLRSTQRKREAAMGKKNNNADEEKNS